MAFPIRLYTFSKAVNSTARPGNEASYFEIDANTNTPISIVNPTVVIHKPDNVTLTGYNYCYVPNWGRYYWVQDWTHDKGLWYATLLVDVLATWRGSIGALTPYVLRAHLNADGSSAWDGNIVDNYYPAKAVWSLSKNEQPTPWEYGTYTSGCYSVGIVSEGGITKFWLMTRATLDELMSYLLSDDFANDVMSALVITAYPEAKAVIDPLQYIASVTWIPLPIGETILTAVKIGYGVKALNVRAVTPSQPWTSTIVFNRPTHPLTPTRGAYVNTAPYTRLSLYMPPFGIVDIDTSRTKDYITVQANLRVDMCQGNGVLEIVIGGQIVTRVCGRVGMPIQLAQIIAPGYGVLSAAKDAAGIAGAIFEGNWGNAAAGLASGIGNAIDSQIPSVNTVGSVGSSDSLVGTPALQAVFTDIVSDDVTSRGRPLCQVRRIDTLRGYIQCIDVEVNVGCTGAEHDMIKAHMERGFFYE